MANCENCKNRIGCGNYAPKSTVACEHYAEDERDVQQLKPSMKEKLTELLLTAEKVADEAGFFNCHKSRPKAELIADYLIQNGVVVLPCKVGDVVYAKSGCFPFRYDHGNIIPCEVFVFKVTKRSKLIKLRPLVEGAMGARHLETWFPISAFGKTVFLTEEEAKRVLKGK